MAIPAPSDGEVFGHYRLVEQIGAGGMGVVWRAYDERLHRDVALKILPPGLFADEAARRQFRNEALTVGKLSHPNIAMAFDFGHENGVDYLVTEFVPGINLDEKIAHQPLPQKSVVEWGMQLASGLDAAHRAGVIHRDLKPGNLRLTPDGHLKILDFGLARQIVPVDDTEDTINIETEPPMSGTLPYMAPEILRGDLADVRTDIWAAGAVLYEMATGKRAYPDRQHTLLVDAILHYDPVRPCLLNPKLSAALEAVILKALDRDPERRYQSARELRVDLARIAAGENATDTIHRTAVLEVGAKSRRRKALLGLALVLLVGIMIGYWITHQPPPPSTQKILAVLPFDTVGQDPATSALGAGLAETLTAKLVQASDSDSIQVVSPRDLRDQGVKTAEDARREFGTDMVLESSLQRQGEAIRINCSLVDSKTRRQIAARTVTGDASDSFGLQDRVVNEVVDILPARLNPKQRSNLNVRQDTQPAAYEAYIRGRGYLQEYEKPENIDSAIAEFQQALKIDPNYAPAYAELGKAYWIGFQQPMNRGAQWLMHASQYCENAAKLSPSLSEAHTCLGNVLYARGKYEEAVKEYKHSLNLTPKDDYAVGQLADAYQKSGNPVAAEAAYKDAIGLRPTYWAVYNWLGIFYAGQARYREAAEVFRKVTELAPENYRGYSNLGGVLLYQGEYSEAIRALNRSIDLRPNKDAYANLGAAYFWLHRFPEAVRACKKALDLDEHDPLSWGNLADALYWAPSRRTEARSAYQRAIFFARSRLAVNPRDGTAAAYIAEYSAMLDDRDSAMTNASKALSLAPNDPEIMFRVALVYNHFGADKTALSWLKKSADAGFSRFNIRDTPDFTELKNTPEFRSLANLS